MTRFLSISLILAFIINGIIPSTGLGQGTDVMQAGMTPMSGVVTPAHLKGMVLDPNDPFKVDFIVARGDRLLPADEKRPEYAKLIRYFMAALTVPDDAQWVNLSPYEKDRVIPEVFGRTGMGRALLAQDYILKQVSAGLLDPGTATGREFWDKVYSSTLAKFGRTDIPLNMLNKVWILPDKAVIYEKGNAVYVLEHHLKVMLESDYVAMKHGGAPASSGADRLSSDIMRTVIVPLIEKEVNEGARFARLRQVYSGMLLAAWYKRALKDSILNRVYGDKAKVNGIDQDPRNNRRIYDRYVAAFKAGAFNMIREERDPGTGDMVPRKYFSGGMANAGIEFDAGQVTRVAQMTPAQLSDASQNTDIVPTVLESVDVPRPRVIVFETKGWDEGLIRTIYGTRFDVVLEQGPLTPAYLAAHQGELGDVQAVNVFLGSKIDENILTALKGACPRLAVIATRTAGTDHVNIEAARQAGIAVVNVPDYGSQAIAEHAVAMMLALAVRQVPAAGQAAMGRVEHGLARLFALAKKLDATIERGKGLDFSRDGIQGINLLDDANHTTIYTIGPEDSLPAATISNLGMLETADIAKAAIVWGDVSGLNPEELNNIRAGAVVINTGRAFTAEEQAVLAGRNIRSSTIPQRTQGVSLKGLTIGIVGGSGKIGQHTIRLAKALGMKVNVFDIDETSAQALRLQRRYGFTYVSMLQLLASSDVVSLHVPLNAHTRHLMGEKEMASMKQGAMLINTARGGVVDTQALLEALHSGRVGTAGLDVIEGEPGIFPQDGQGPAASEDLDRLKALLADARVIVTPHNAYNTTASAYQMIDITGRAISKALDKGADAAGITQADPAMRKGGIDMDPASLQMQIRRDGNGVVLPASQQDLEGVRMSGLIPVLLEIHPADVSMPLFKEAAPARL